MTRIDKGRPVMAIVNMESDLDNVIKRSISTRTSQRFLQGSILTFHNINYSVKQKSGLPCRRKVTVKEILKNVNGIMKPGMNAILGPTGGGKSSLLDVLAARKDPNGLEGIVLVDGAPQPPNFKCVSGYVVQDDVVMGTLTVRENFQFSAALRLPQSISQQEKKERVNQIIQELGLTKCADSKVGTELIRGVSGGERKRTNIGMELINDPSVLFLDEPTTGLDASTANAVLLLLKRMSRKGRTIIFSIHQPRYSIFKLFDSLTLLASGSLVYHGPAKTALSYFQTLGYECEPYNNPADFFLDIINGDSTAVAAMRNEKCDDSGEEEIDLSPNDEEEVKQGEHRTIAEQLQESYHNSNVFKTNDEELRKILASVGSKASTSIKTQRVTYATSFFHQLYWVTKRSVTNLSRNPQVSIAQLVVTLVLGLIVGAIFFGAKLDPSGIQNRVGSLFFITTNQCFSSVSAIELFIREKKIFTHEYISGYYRVSAYFLAKVMSDLIPMRTLPAAVFSIVTYWMIGFQATAGQFFIFMLTVVLVAYTATSMALAISAGQSVVAVANLLITICFVFMIIFSGLLVNLPSVMGWLNWLKYFSIPRYGLTGLQVNEFRGLMFCGSNYTSASFTCNSTSANTGAICTGEDYLCRQGIGTNDWALWENLVALGCMTIIFLAITYLKLRFMKKLT
ncbi:broad substrate specificity ATP-binding cassette transporter ABCG2 isoform X1 [Lampetra planeri]